MRKTVFLLASLFVMACGIQSVKAQKLVLVLVLVLMLLYYAYLIAHVEHLNSEDSRDKYRNRYR